MASTTILFHVWNTGESRTDSQTDQSSKRFVCARQRKVVGLPQKLAFGSPLRFAHCLSWIRPHMEATVATAERAHSDPSAIESGIVLPASQPPTRLPTVDMAEATALLQEAAAVVMEAPPLTPTILRTPQETDERPWDSLGPPTDPLPFARPRFERGRRDQVLCYIPETETYERFNNVLFRDESSAGKRHIEWAYYPVPYKKPIRTIMGHVEICRVLKRNRICHDEDSGSEENGNEYDEEDDDEVCFELTSRAVAVKVNFDSR